MDSIYLPHTAEIVSIKEETADVKTFNLKFKEDRANESFKNYLPGQFVELTALGEGEATFCISNSATRSSTIECSIKKMGLVTSAVHDLDVGDVVGIRGPYGNGFPVEELKNKNLLFVAGGIGLAPLRSLINYCIDNRQDYGKIIIVNGARSSQDLVFKEEYASWEKAKDTEVHLTIDNEEKNWKHNIGVIPKIVEKISPSPKNCVAVVCGPPIMIRYSLPILTKLGFRPEDIVTTLEMKMKCGVGKCGRCNIGSCYICKDGPVFRYDKLKELNYEI